MADEKGQPVLQIIIQPPPTTVPVITSAKKSPKLSGLGLKSKKISPTEADDRVISRLSSERDVSNKTATTKQQPPKKDLTPVSTPVPPTHDARDVVCGLWMALGLLVFFMVEIITSVSLHSEIRITEVFFAVFLLVAMMSSVLIVIAQLASIFEWKAVETLIDSQSDLEMFSLILLNIVTAICVLDIVLVLYKQSSYFASVTLLRMHIFCYCLVASCIYMFVLIVKIYQRCS